MVQRRFPCAAQYRHRSRQCRSYTYQSGALYFLQDDENELANFIRSKSSGVLGKIRLFPIVRTVSCTHVAVLTGF